MNSCKVNAVIEHIKSCDMFDLDWMDLDEMSPYDVLDHFGVDEIFNEWEEAEFMTEIEKLAWNYQTGEIVKSVFECVT
jgi:hypothetical protein